MTHTQEDITYSSWITREEDADDVLTALTQHIELVVIDDADNVLANSVLIFDTSKFSK